MQLIDILHSYSLSKNQNLILSGMSVSIVYID